MKSLSPETARELVEAFNEIFRLTHSAVFHGGRLSATSGDYLLNEISKIVLKTLAKAKAELEEE